MPFQEQLDYLKAKAALPAPRHDSIMREAHDCAFIVSGAMKMDLLTDLHQAITKNIEQGQGIGQFRKDFNAIADRHGWNPSGERGWRTRLIYTTNVATSYAAGRYRQLTDPDLLKARPFWKYVHSDNVLYPRPLHVKWHGTVLPYNHPWWRTHFGPNGYGCQCHVQAVTADEYTGQAAPDDGSYTRTGPDGRERTTPNGIDFGWDYTPGQSTAAILRSVIAKQDGAVPWQIAKANTQALVKSPAFESFYQGAPSMGEVFPVGVLDPDGQGLLQASPTVVVTRAAVGDAAMADYAQVQGVLDQGEIYAHGGQFLAILAGAAGAAAIAVHLARDSESDTLTATVTTGRTGAIPEGAEKIR